jgi:hypothetical protein
MVSLKISLFVVFCIYLQFAQGLHQIISESEKKCFIEEVPRDTLVLVTWKAEDLTRSHAEQNENPLGFKIVVRDPDQQNVYQKQHGFSGRAAFTSLVGGEYQVCAQTNASRWFGTNIEIVLSFPFYCIIHRLASSY